MMTHTLLIKQILFLTGLLFSQPAYEQVSIPVEVGQGGTVCIEALEASAPLPAATEMKLADGEEGKMTISFLTPGEFTYRLKQLPQSDPYMITDQTVYILQVKTGEEGKLESVILYAEGSDEKNASAHWQNRILKPPVNTADPGYFRGYFWTSLGALVISAVLFKAAGGRDEEN